jgi:8-oxo-dGTP pyrophosphatase MutT (NUDIX family)
MQDEATCVFVVDMKKRKVLLGIKQRGPGNGRFNGPGGKVMPGDKSILERAIRELREESGIKADEKELYKVGQIVFRNGDDNPCTVHFFILKRDARRVKAMITESDEMKGFAWFSFDNLPFNKMIRGDREFIPRFLAGEHLRGYVKFGDDFSVVEGLWLCRDYFGGEQ